MDKYINFCEFMRYVFNDEKAVEQGAAIVKALLDAQSPRLTNISKKMDGNSSRNYKMLQRFLKKVDLKRLLLRFYQEEAEFVMETQRKWSAARLPKRLMWAL
jgi:hypothetical protein